MDNSQPLLYRMLARTRVIINQSMSQPPLMRTFTYIPASGLGELESSEPSSERSITEQAEQDQSKDTLKQQQSKNRRLQDQTNTPKSRRHHPFGKSHCNSPRNDEKRGLPTYKETKQAVRTIQQAHRHNQSCDDELLNMRQLISLGRERDSFLTNPLFLGAVAGVLLVFMYYISYE